MAKNGFRAFDSDMHVFEPADLYIKYMNPKWGERVPRGKPRTKHGMTRYFLGDGKPIRPPSDVVSFHENRMADRFNESLARDYDNVSQLAGEYRGRNNQAGTDRAIDLCVTPGECAWRNAFVREVSELRGAQIKEVMLVSDRRCSFFIVRCGHMSRLAVDESRTLGFRAAA